MTDQVKTAVLPVVAAMLWSAVLPALPAFGNQLFASVSVLKTDRLAYLLAAGAMVFQALRQPRSLQPLGRVERAMAIYLAVVLVSWGVTLPNKGMVAFKQDADFLLTCFLMPFTAFLIARNVEWTSRRVVTCIWVLVGGVGLFLLLLGTVQYAYDWNFLVRPVMRSVHPDRAKGTFDNAVPYGVVLLILLTLALFLYGRSARRGARLVLWPIAFGLLQCIVASKTRAVWLALPVVFLILAVQHPRIRFLAIALTADLALQVLLAPAVGLDFWGLHTRLVQASPVYNRVAASATAWNMIEHKPLFGFGFGISTFQTDKPDFYSSWGNVAPDWAVLPQNPHNDILNVMVLMGMVGLLPYLALLWASWQVLWERSRRGAADAANRELASFVQAIFLTLLIVGQSHSVMYMSYPQIVLFFLLGIVARQPAAAVRLVEAGQRADTVPAGWIQPAAEVTRVPGGDYR